MNNSRNKHKIQNATQNNNTQWERKRERERVNHARQVGELPPWLILKFVDALLRELKRRKEDGVEQAGSGHGHAETAVHLALEKVDLDRLHFLSFRVEEGVSLVDALGRVDRIYWVSELLAVFLQGEAQHQHTDHGPRNDPAQAARNEDGQCA